MGGLLEGLPIVGGLFGGGNSSGGGGGGLLGGLPGLGGGSGGGGLLGGLPGLGGGGGGGGLLGGILGGGGSGGGLLGGLLGGGGGGGLLGGLFGGGGSGSGQTPYQLPPNWLQTAPGTPPVGSYPGYPVPQQSPQPSYNFNGDLSQPGQGETFFGQNQGKFTAPTASQNYWNSNQTRFGAPGQGEQYWQGVAGQFNSHQPTSNNAQTAFNTFQSSQPVNMNPYYDDASRRTANTLNNQYAARGLFGSSAALQGLSDAETHLRAQQAQDEAGYQLNRGGLLGNLASGADTSSRGVSQDLLSWLSGGGSMANAAQNLGLQNLIAGGNLAQGADATGMNLLNSGMNAALGAQGALSNRAQGYFNNLFNLGNAQSNAMAGMYLPMIQSDMSLFDQAVQAMLGYPREAANQVTQGRAASEEGIGNAAGLFGKILGGII